MKLKISDREFTHNLFILYMRVFCVILSLPNANICEAHTHTHYTHVTIKTTNRNAKS